MYESQCLTQEQLIDKVFINILNKGRYKVIMDNTMIFSKHK